MICSEEDWEKYCEACNLAGFNTSNSSRPIRELSLFRPENQDAGTSQVSGTSAYATDHVEYRRSTSHESLSGAGNEGLAPRYSGYGRTSHFRHNPNEWRNQSFPKLVPFPPPPQGTLMFFEMMPEYELSRGMTAQGLLLHTSSRSFAEAREEMLLKLMPEMRQRMSFDSKPILDIRVGAHVRDVVKLDIFIVPTYIIYLLSMKHPLVAKD